jgi:hypothetical protein
LLFGIGPFHTENEKFCSENGVCTQENGVSCLEKAVSSPEIVHTVKRPGHSLKERRIYSKEIKLVKRREEYYSTGFNECHHKCYYMTLL